MTSPSTPSPDPVLDPELARWLERSEAIAVAPEIYAASAALPGDPVGARFAPIGDGFVAALTVIDAAFFNRAVGIGTDPADHRGRRRGGVEVLRRPRDARKPLFHLPPAALTPEVEGWLTARGYRGGRRWVKMWHDLADLPDAGDVPTDRADRHVPGS